MLVAVVEGQRSRSRRATLIELGSLQKRGVSPALIDLGGDVTGNGISKLVSPSCLPSPRRSASALRR
ncbi:MAG: hypothetical protein J2P47_13710 [Acetobacteraceae bacterium]|nr:hypothetical protein [Acetobacteraceae bacterium]